MLYVFNTSDSTRDQGVRDNDDKDGGSAQASQTGVAVRWKGD